ncbi:MAG: hypothetical protein ACRD1A_04470, partial [Terriglobales bacterium]
MLDAAAAMSAAAPANLLRLLSDETEFRLYLELHGAPDQAFFAAAAQALAEEARGDAAAAAAAA